RWLSAETITVPAGHARCAACGTRLGDTSIVTCSGISRTYPSVISISAAVDQRLGCITHSNFRGKQGTMSDADRSNLAHGHGERRMPKTIVRRSGVRRFLRRMIDGLGLLPLYFRVSEWLISRGTARAPRLDVDGIPIPPRLLITQVAGGPD